MTNLGENEDGFGYLERANKTSEWIVTFYLEYMVVSNSGMMTTSLFSIFYCYLTRGELNANNFYRPGRFV